jgi:hypothetical protein
VSAHNRRLVPMPTRRRASTSNVSSAPIAPSGLKTWHCFAFLIVAAIVWTYLKWPLIIAGYLTGFFLT